MIQLSLITAGLSQQLALGTGTALHGNDCGLRGETIEEQHVFKLPALLAEWHNCVSSWHVGISTSRQDHWCSVTVGKASNTSSCVAQSNFRLAKLIASSSPWQGAFLS